MDFPSAPSAADMSIPGLKQTMVNFLKLSGRDDMVAPVEKYCDDECGIVFNRHPAKDEESFANIHDYRCVVRSKSELTCNPTARSQPQEAGRQHAAKFIPRSSYSSSSIPRGSRVSKLPPQAPPKATKVVDRSRAFTRSQRSNKRRGSTGQIAGSRLSVDPSNCEYDLITTKGRGRILNHVGNYHVHVELENKTRTCLPLKSVQFFDSYIRKNPSCALMCNYQIVDSKRVDKLLNDQKERIRQFSIVQESVPLINSDPRLQPPSEYGQFQEKFRNPFEEREFSNHTRMRIQKNGSVHFPDDSNIDQSRTSWSDFCEYN